MAAQAGDQSQAKDQNRHADGQVASHQEELGRTADPRQHGNLVELVRDEVERRRDPADAPVGPGGERGQTARIRLKRRQLPVEIMLTRPASCRFPDSAMTPALAAIIDLAALSIASRRARNSLSGFHSGKRSLAPRGSRPRG